MRTLLYGTGNAGKLASMRRALEGLPVALTGLAELGVSPPDVRETGETPLENARIKAEACFRALRRPVFSCDSGLYLEGLPAALQAGVHVRRVGGRTLTDGEMTDYYAGLAREYGPLRARYRNAVCFVADEIHRFESADDALSGGVFLLVSQPHSRRQAGLPLDCLSVEPVSGKYYYELGAAQADDIALNRGFYRFFEEALRELGWL